MKVRLEKMNLWSINGKTLTSSYNTISIRTEGGITMQIPISFELFEKIEEMLFIHLKNDLQNEISNGLTGETKTNHFLLDI